MPPETVLRDAVWGDIALGPRELALIDTPAFQRLRRVKQLGLTDLVYPGARHTRFEHSIGVFYLAGLALGRIAGLDASPVVPDADARALLTAALLHDVGHYPFSHAIEELEMDQVRRHTDIARDLITGELADVLTERWDVDPELVAIFVAGAREDGNQPTDAQTLLRGVLDSGMDVDKLDYLVRDARGANVPYGLVDVQRLIGALAVVRDDDGRLRLGVDRKGVAALQSLVYAKHLMFATVYWHHACRSAVVMLQRCVQEALRSGYLEPSGVERSDDRSLLATLSRRDAPSVTAELAQRLLDRRLYKRAIDVPAGDPSFEALESMWFSPTKRSVLEDGWAVAAGARPGDVLLDVPEPKRIVVDVPVVADGSSIEWDSASGLAIEDLERFQGSVRTIRVFASSRELAATLRERRAELFPTAGLGS